MGITLLQQQKKDLLNHPDARSIKPYRKPKTEKPIQRRPRKEKEEGKRREERIEENEDENDDDEESSKEETQDIVTSEENSREFQDSSREEEEKEEEKKDINEDQPQHQEPVVPEPAEIIEPQTTTNQNEERWSQEAKESKEEDNSLPLTNEKEIDNHIEESNNQNQEQNNIPNPQQEETLDQTEEQQEVVDDEEEDLVPPYDEIKEECNKMLDKLNPTSRQSIRKWINEMKKYKYANAFFYQDGFEAIKSIPFLTICNLIIGEFPTTSKDSCSCKGCNTFFKGYNDRINHRLDANNKCGEYGAADDGRGKNGDIMAMITRLRDEDYGFMVNKTKDIITPCKPMTRCPYCNFRTNLDTEVERHIRGAHSKNEVLNQVGYFWAYISVEVNGHKRSHTTGEEYFKMCIAYKCPECEYMCTSAEHVLSHLRRFHDKQEARMSDVIKGIAGPASDLEQRRQRDVTAENNQHRTVSQLQRTQFENQIPVHSVIENTLRPRPQPPQEPPTEFNPQRAPPTLNITTQSRSVDIPEAPRLAISDAQVQIERQVVQTPNRPDPVAIWQRVTSSFDRNQEEREETQVSQEENDVQQENDQRRNEDVPPTKKRDLMITNRTINLFQSQKVRQSKQQITSSST